MQHIGEVYLDIGIRQGFLHGNIVHHGIVPVHACHSGKGHGLLQGECNAVSHSSLLSSRFLVRLFFLVFLCLLFIIVLSRCGPVILAAAGQRGKRQDGSQCQCHNFFQLHNKLPPLFFDVGSTRSALFMLKLIVLYIVPDILSRNTISILGLYK